MLNRKLIFAALAMTVAMTPAWAQKSKPSMTTEITNSLPDQSTGGVTPAIMRSVLTDMVNSWQQYAAVNSQVGTSYTVQASDYGQIVQLNNASPISVTLPAPTGSFTTFNVFIYNLGTGAATVTSASGTINGNASLTINSTSAYWLFSDGSGTNYVSFSQGGLLTSVSNSDGTLTISPTTGVVVASLALGHANTWTGIQSFNSGKLALNGASSGVTTLNANATSGTVTATLPANTGIIAELNYAQTWSAAQTFTNSDIKLLGSSTGATTFTSANAGASNYTWTIPAATDTVAGLNTPDQTLAGGANVTSYSIGTFSASPAANQIDCGKSPLQYATGYAGAYKITAPASDGSCIVLVTNASSSAAVPTLTSFTVGSNTGDTWTTTGSAKFAIQIWTINGTSRYLISAYQ